MNVLFATHFFTNFRQNDVINTYLVFVGVFIQTRSTQAGLWLAGGGGGRAPPVFCRSVNPVSIRGAHYAHQITTCPPPGFSDLATALPCTTWWCIMFTMWWIGIQHFPFLFDALLGFVKFVSRHNQKGLLFQIPRACVDCAIRMKVGVVFAGTNWKSFSNITMKFS